RGLPMGRTGLGREDAVRLQPRRVLPEVAMNVRGLRVVVGGRAGEIAATGAPAPAGLLAELYEKHAAGVYGRCRYLLRDDAEAKEIAVLYFVYELSQAEIAQEMGRSLRTVRKRLREFLACCREGLGIELEGGDL